MHRLVTDEQLAVSEVTVSDGVQAARLIAFSEVEGEQIIHQVEYWPAGYEPPTGREDLTRRIERIP